MSDIVYKAQMTTIGSTSTDKIGTFHNSILEFHFSLFISKECSGKEDKRNFIVNKYEPE